MKPTIESTIRSRYFRYAIVPILLIELMLLVLYFSINSYVSSRTGERVLEESRANLQQIIHGEARLIDLQLAEISRNLHWLQARQQSLWQQPLITEQPTTEFGYSPTGTYYKLADNGGSTVTVSSRQPIDDQIRADLQRTEQFDGLFAAVADNNPHIAAVYYNTPWQMTRYYPWFDGMEQLLPRGYDVANYNFYYEADPAHNPEREVVWTGAYLDPAGKGWMISGLVPVYDGDRFEGVTGIDVQIGVLVSSMLDLELPYQGAPLLLDSNGSMLAMSEGVGELLGVQELTEHSYQTSVTEAVFKPASFSLYHYQANPELAAAVRQLAESDQSSAFVTQQGQGYFLYQSPIQHTGWSLLVFVPEAGIYGPVKELQILSSCIGYTAVLAMVVFYLVFFIYLRRNAQRIARDIAAPIGELADASCRMGLSMQVETMTEPGIEELDRLASNFNTMARQLDERTRSLVVSELDRQEKSRLANTDHLTGLFNRRYFNQVASALATGPKQVDAPLALMIVDIDHFKAINDCYGHQAGDEALIIVARTLQETVADRGVVARLGGEEFAIVSRMPADAAEQLARQVCQRIAVTDLGACSGSPESVTVSIGLVSEHAPGPLSTLMARADEALYQAKRAGRNRVVAASSQQPELEPA